MCIRDRKLPKQALKGTFFSQIQQQNQQDTMQLQAKLAPPMAPGGEKPGAGSSSKKLGSMPPGKEKWRLRDTNDGYIFENLSDEFEKHFNE